MIKSLLFQKFGHIIPQQLEGMCVELEVANSKENSRQLDSQINYSNVQATSAMYPVSDWRKFD